MTFLKPLCRNYSLRAEPSGDGRGWIGIYGLPGKDEQLARDGDRLAEVFENEEAALAGAAEDLIDALNGRSTYRSKRRYEHMSGADLAVALRRADLTPAEFARLFGTTQERVLKEWIDGVPMRNGQPPTVPHAAHVLIKLFGEMAPDAEGLPIGFQNIQTAEEVTKQATLLDQDLS